ncbi:unnamed protein product [Rotaria magnacalcarata]|uniref:2-amino-3-carboxymuconate-6-semialdehyde decarboxylase n=5 Tax=Rotaria magnacalcarata TaxID=392030 RepID=A0A816RG80_9BILA|nr:unnamed protein product [Rotaria magnacalcarata]
MIDYSIYLFVDIHQDLTAENFQAIMQMFRRSPILTAPWKNHFQASRFLNEHPSTQNTDDSKETCEVVKDHSYDLLASQTGEYKTRILDITRIQGARVLGSLVNQRPRRVDTHHHIVPDFYAQAIKATGGDPSGWPTPKWSLQSANEQMSLLGVEIAFVSITAPGTKIYEGNTEKGRNFARKLNEFSSNLVQQDPAKFGFFASLPSLIDIEGAIAEIDYAHSILKADGFILFTSYDYDKYLGHSSFRPVWTKLNDINSVIFIHPSEAPTTIVNRYMPQPFVDYPHETTRTAADIVLSGTRAAFPNLKIILSHAGGTLPFLGKRLAGAGLIRSLKCPLGPRQILSDLRSFYFDTALSSSVPQLKALLEFADPSKILFGSDVPYASFPLSFYMTKCFDSFFKKNYSKNKHNDILTNINRNNAKALFIRKITD